MMAHIFRPEETIPRAILRQTSIEKTSRAVLLQAPFLQLDSALVYLPGDISIYFRVNDGCDTVCSYPNTDTVAPPPLPNQ